MSAPIRNPFDDAIVSDAWTAPQVDVAEIHQDVSELCLESVEIVRDEGRPRSILVHGSAGSGKTHLLARLRNAMAAGDAAPVFCYVRLATAAHMIRRHLNRALVSDLVRSDSAGISQLDRVLVACLDKQAGGTGAVGDDDVRRRLEAFQHDRDARDADRLLFREASERLELDFNLARACGLWLFRRKKLEVIEFLKSGDLPDEELVALGLKRRQDDDGDDAEQAAARVVIQLCRLITSTRPLVLCFDQLEALKTSAKDQAGFFALGNLVSDLFDQGLPIVFICCAQSMLLPEIHAAIPKPFLDRLAQHQKVLASLSESQARALVAARVAASPALKNDERHKDDRLWPLTEPLLGQFMADGDRTPRRLFAMCRDGVTHGHASGRSLASRLNDEFETRRTAALGRVDDTDGAFVDGLSRVALAKQRFEVQPPGDRRDVDLVLAREGQPVLISVCNQRGNALTARLKRIRAAATPGDEQRVVVRDADRPIPRTSAVALRHWAEIHSEARATPPARVRPLSASAEMLAALAAVRSLMADALSGDLEQEGQTVPPQSVEAWIRDHIFDESVEKLLAEIEFGTAEVELAVPVDPTLRDAALEIVKTRSVTSAAELAREVGCSETDLLAIVAADAAVFGVLGSPPAVVFDRVPTQSPESNDAD